jgi:pimeloyl-ACP methyl ester carboxylesterase
MGRYWIAIGSFVLAGVLMTSAAQSQVPRAGGDRPPRAYVPPTAKTTRPTKMSFVPLANNANALILEPVTPDPQRSRFALLIVHPEHSNTFNYFIAPEMADRGYRVMMLNYHGPEVIYEEYLAPMAAAVRYLRSLPGVQKVVLAGHSGGGAMLTAYQEVAETRGKGCQIPERVYPCRGANLDNLPPADGIMMLDARAGVVERLAALDPSIVDKNRPSHHQPDLDMFSPKNGFDATTKSGKYTPEFEQRFLKAQGARQTKLIDEALARLAKIEKGEGVYKDDEPFVIPGSSQHTYDGAALHLADLRLLSKTHGPHMLLKADGSRPVQIIPTTYGGLSEPEHVDQMGNTTQEITVRNFLSYLAMRTKPDYNVTEDRITGVEWRSVANSIPGSVQAIAVPSLFMPGTCASHLVYLETAYDLSAAKDKEFVAVEGGNHSFAPCKPEYGDSARHAFDYVDSWLMKPGRF